MIQEEDPDVRPSLLYVQFESPNLNISGAKTGIDGFDRKAAPYNVMAIEKAFPSLDVVARQRPLSSVAESLRRVYVVHYASAHSPVQVARNLAGTRGVVYAEPIYKSKGVGGEPGPELASRMATPNDSRYTQQTHLPRMQLPAAWDVVKGEDSTVVIAIVDGGTDWRHPDLRNNVWINPGEIDGNSIDDDNNGYVDDIHG